jgi:hypothetical protein
MQCDACVCWIKGMVRTRNSNVQVEAQVVLFMK